jgi:hypothetical protein
MKKGRQRVEELRKRLQAAREQIDSWEEREAEWQTRISRRLRIFWAIMVSAVLVLVLALVVQHWPAISSPHHDKAPVPSELAKLVNESSAGPDHPADNWESVLSVHDSGSVSGTCWYPSSLADRLHSLEHARTAPSASESANSRAEGDHAGTEHDPFRLLDEL